MPPAKSCFDTRQPSDVGEDYSRFRDVKLTLEGRYGARASLRDPNDPFSTVLYIAAPIYRDGQVAGVLTLVEPTATIDTFLQLARPAFVRAGAPHHRRRRPAQPRPLLLVDPSHRPPRALRGRHPPGQAPALSQARPHRDRRPRPGDAPHAGGARRPAIRGRVRPDPDPRAQEPALRDPRRGGASAGRHARPAAGPFHRQHPQRSRAASPASSIACWSWPVSKTAAKNRTWNRWN